MANVNLHINGREYRIACDDGQEKHLQRVTADVDHKVRELARAMGPTTPENFLLVLAAVMFADENADLKRALNKLREQATHTSQAFEQNKQIEMESMLSGVMNRIAARIEKIAAAV